MNMTRGCAKQRKDTGKRNDPKETWPPTWLCLYYMQSGDTCVLYYQQPLLDALHISGQLDQFPLQQSSAPGLQTPFQCSMQGHMTKICNI